MMPLCRCWAQVRPRFLALTWALLTAAGCAAGSAGAEAHAAETSAGGSVPPTMESATLDDAVTIMGAGDIADKLMNAKATGELIRAADPDAVFTTGDNAYPDGAPSDYEEFYEPAWGFFRERTHPVPGNHDYVTQGAAGYVGFFGEDAVTNDVDGGLYYAWDVGNGWRAYAVNTEISTSDEQLTWLQNDVEAHPGMHYILYGHRPRYTSGVEHDPSEKICPLWDVLAATGGLEIVLAGHNHQYERFAPMDCDGRESEDGARSFVVGSGGRQLYDFREPQPEDEDEPQPESEFRNKTDYGVLKLVLSADSYEWEFIASGRGYDLETEEHVDTGNAGEVLDKGSQDV